MKKGDIVWAVGESFKLGVKNGEGKPLSDVWMLEGLFLTEEEAISNCKEHEFIISVPFGERLVEEVRDLVSTTHKAYFPHLEKWEESAMYKIRNGSKKLSDFGL